jgi:hypothetical protein
MIHGNQNASRRPATAQVRAHVGLILGCATLLIGLLLAPASAQAAFGVGGFDTTFTGPEGAPAMQAGSHPFAMTTSFTVASRQEAGIQVLEGALRDLEILEPAGFVGDTTALPRCSTADFLALTNGGASCADSTAVGTLEASLLNNGLVDTEPSPLYNLVPDPHEAAKLGAIVEEVPVTINLGLNPDPPYNVQVDVVNTPQILEFVGARTTVWGVPADPGHDGDRGECGMPFPKRSSCPSDAPLRPFLTLPRSCAGPLTTTWSADSWWAGHDPLDPGPGERVSGSVLTHDASTPPQPLGTFGCAALGFHPTTTAKPTSVAASSPTGLDFSLDTEDEGLTSPEGIADADLRKAVVSLPEGFSVNPSIAEGLAVCSEAELARETPFSAPGEGCPDASKIGTVEVETPLLAESVDGAIYQATPYQNPFASLVALYMVIRNPTVGIIIKQPLKVETDPATGQITTVAEDLPELPFAHFRLHFREGTRSPLATPRGCGTFATTATLYPSSGGAPSVSNAAFQIIVGPESGPCPSGGTPPFHPGLTAGTINNAAGSYSPFDIRISRNDSEQEITHFSIKLPPGVTGKLAGIPFCGDAEIAAAKARERTPHGGQEELERPSCPQASEIGRTLVGSGIGPSPTYVPGKVYLAGPYNGSNLSIVSITAAKAGPFDLGTVVIREGLKVDPVTAEVSVDAAGSDPIPHIVEGIPVDLKDIRVYVDRPEFTKNPTSCEPTSTASTILGAGTDFASEADDRPVTVTSRFQAADCASHGFRPHLKISLKGPTRRAGLPALTAVVRPRPGDANIGRAVVTLPKSEFLEQGHIGNSCTRVQFNSGAGNGAGCPANSVLGHAVAVTPLLSEPLEGPVFLRSNGGERKLPDLVAALHSKLIDIDLLGFISSLHRKGSDVSQIRTTFAAVPDQPVTKFTLRMFGGKKGLLVNSTNLCKGTHRAISTFVGQNGRRYQTRPAVKARCGKKGRKHKKKSKGHTAAKGKGSSLAVAFRHRVAW